MTIEEIRATREKAEIEMLEVILRFKKLTGMGISGCSLETVNFLGAENNQPVVVPVRVILDIEI